MTFDLEIAAQASLTREDIGALVRPVDLPEELLRGQIDARASAQRVGGGAVGAAPAAEAALCPSCAGSGRSQQACPDIMSGASGNLRFSKTGTFIGRTSSSSRKGVPRKATWLVARDGGWECFSEHMMDLLEEAWDDGVGAKISIQLPDRGMSVYSHVPTALATHVPWSGANPMLFLTNPTTTSSASSLSVCLLLGW